MANNHANSHGAGGGDPITADLTNVNGILGIANGGTSLSSIASAVTTWMLTPTSANFAAALTDETGTSSVVLSKYPVFVSTIGLGNTAAVTSGAGISFPATQAPSTDPNTMDDYEEGTWTPVLTFATPGDLSVSYTRQLGTYTKVGRLVTITYAIVTSAFTWTTASGNLQLNGLPFTSLTQAGYQWHGICTFSGITKAGYTQIAGFVAQASNIVSFVGSGSGVATSNVNAADMPTGGSVVLRGQFSYEV